MSPAGFVGLRALAEALPPGAAVSVPREWILELLRGRDETNVQTHDALPPTDLTVSELTKRFERKPSTVRGWIETGRFPGAYRFQNREWRVPIEDVLRFEATSREAPKEPQRRQAGPTPGRSRSGSLSDWKKVTN